MLRYDSQTKPGLVALYDIRPGNGAGPFLQPRSPDGAKNTSILVSLVLTSTSFLAHSISTLSKMTCLFNFPCPFTFTYFICFQIAATAMTRC